MSNHVLPRWALVAVAVPLLVWVFFSRLIEEMGGAFWHARQEVKIAIDELKTEWEKNK